MLLVHIFLVVILASRLNILANDDPFDSLMIILDSEECVKGFL